MAEPVIELLRDLIAIDSVNPALAPGAAGESQIGAAISHHLQAAGLDVELQEVSDGRANVIGVLKGKKKGPTLMLCGHMDTVGISGYEKPFDPVQKAGRIYGRGSQDMKGGLASMISATTNLARRGLESGCVILAAVCDEEYASIGADALIQKWKADAAIVGEPTDMRIAVGHKGFEWVEITTEGIAAHGSRPDEGRDAIMSMGRILARLERLDKSIQQRAPHPILGTASLHASIIAGGQELSTYPDKCVLQVERRTLTGEGNFCALDEVEKIIESLRADDSEFKASARHLFGRHPYETPLDHPLPSLIETAVGRVGRQTSRSGASFWTDASILGNAGIPSVVFGPGGAGLHSVSEYVWEDDVVACRDALVILAEEFCLKP